MRRSMHSGHGCVKLQQAYTVLKRDEGFGRDL